MEDRKPLIARKHPRPAEKSAAQIVACAIAAVLAAGLGRCMQLAAVFTVEHYGAEPDYVPWYVWIGCSAWTVVGLGCGFIGFGLILALGQWLEFAIGRPCAKSADPFDEEL